MAEQKFVDGLFVKKPNENAPDFVKAGLSFNVEKFIEYLKENANAKGYVNVSINESQKGSYYAKLDTWQPEQQG